MCNKTINNFVPYDMSKQRKAFEQPTVAMVTTPNATSLRECLFSEKTLANVKYSHIFLTIDKRTYVFDIMCLILVHFSALNYLI